MFEAHIHELEALWNGKTHFSSTTINYTLSGKRIDVQLRGAIYRVLKLRLTVF